ncbi:hypothetical protein BH23CHL9_BH23CHL9_11050 [soil metagenome]
MTRLQSREADAEPNEPGLRATLARLLKSDLARDPDKLLLLLLGTDAILILLHVLHVYSGYFADLSYSIGMERGFGETFQYIKEGWIVLMLVILAVRMRGPLYACWAAFFCLLLADDLFIVRERIGMGIGLELDLGPLFGLRQQDIGELIVIGVFAALLVVPVILAQLLAGADARAFGRSMGAAGRRVRRLRRGLRHDPRVGPVPSLLGQRARHRRGGWRDDRHEPHRPVRLPDPARTKLTHKRDCAAASTCMRSAL